MIFIFLTVWKNDSKCGLWTMSQREYSGHPMDPCKKRGLQCSLTDLTSLLPFSIAFCISQYLSHSHRFSQRSSYHPLLKMNKCSPRIDRALTFSLASQTWVTSPQLLQLETTKADMGGKLFFLCYTGSSKCWAWNPKPPKHSEAAALENPSLTLDIQDTQI